MNHASQFRTCTQKGTALLKAIIAEALAKSPIPAAEQDLSEAITACTQAGEALNRVQKMHTSATRLLTLIGKSASLPTRNAVQDYARQVNLEVIKATKTLSDCATKERNCRDRLQAAQFPLHALRNCQQMLSELMRAETDCNPCITLHEIVDTFTAFLEQTKQNNPQIAGALSCLNKAIARQKFAEADLNGWKAALQCFPEASPSDTDETTATARATIKSELFAAEKLFAELTEAVAVARSLLDTALKVLQKHVCFLAEVRHALQIAQSKW